MTDLLNEAFAVTFRYGNYTPLWKHWHGTNVICPDAKLFYLTKGAIRLTFQNEIKIARAGDLVLIPDGYRHSFALEEEDTEKYWFHFRIQHITGSFFHYYSFPLITDGKKQDAQIRSLFETVLACAKEDTPFDALQLRGGIFSLIGLYFRLSRAVLAQTVSTDVIDRTVSYMESHLTEDLQLTELANAAHLSPSYFIRKFKERKGCAPMHYLNQLRIENAKSLLENSDLNVSAIMTQVGFYDAAYFSRLFRIHTGYSPQQFRRMYRK